MTLKEYSLRIKSLKLKQIEKERDLHYQSWLNRQVKVTKKVGDKHEYVYKKFDDFYDYKKRLEEIENKSLDKEKSRLANIAHMANERR